MSFEGRVAFVTGAGSGLGRCVAQLLASAGASVAVADLPARAEEAAQAITASGWQAMPVALDVTNSASVGQAVQSTVEVYGRLDCAVNSAAVPPDDRPLHLLDEEEFKNVIGVNLTGVALCLQHELVQMMNQSGGGAIVNIGSTRSLRAAPSAPAYSAAKFAVKGLTESAAAAYGSHGIRVNAVCPGVMNTPMVQARRARSGESEADYLPRFFVAAVVSRW